MVQHCSTQTNVVYKQKLWIIWPVVRLVRNGYFQFSWVIIFFSFGGFTHRVCVCAVCVCLCVRACRVWGGGCMHELTRMCVYGCVHTCARAFNITFFWIISDFVYVTWFMEVWAEKGKARFWFRHHLLRHGFPESQRNVVPAFLPVLHVGHVDLALLQTLAPLLHGRHPQHGPHRRPPTPLRSLPRPPFLHCGAARARRRSRRAWPTFSQPFRPRPRAGTSRTGGRGKNDHRRPSRGEKSADSEAGVPGLDGSCHVLGHLGHDGGQREQGRAPGPQDRLGDHPDVSGARLSSLARPCPCLASRRH